MIYFQGFLARFRGFGFCWNGISNLHFNEKNSPELKSLNWRFEMVAIQPEESALKIDFKAPQTFKGWFFGSKISWNSTKPLNSTISGAMINLNVWRENQWISDKISLKFQTCNFWSQENFSTETFENHLFTFVQFFQWFCYFGWWQMCLNYFQSAKNI